jgi:hypothetical protein
MSVGVRVAHPLSHEVHRGNNGWACRALRPPPARRAPTSSPCSRTATAASPAKAARPIPTGTSSSATGLGYRLGARLLIFEGYYDYTGFGAGSSVTRGIFGLRGGFGSDKLRLVLRGGGGVIEEDGGALTGRGVGAPDRRGAVARIGAAVEGHIAPLLLVGVGVDGETFALPATGGPYGTTGAITGSDVFAKLHILFELGV